MSLVQNIYSLQYAGNDVALTEVIFKLHLH